MTQYHVAHTVVTDSAEAAADLASAVGTDFAGILEQPGVTHLGTSITALCDDGERTIRDRIDALIDYLGEDQALQALQVKASRDVAYANPTTNPQTNSESEK